ncbi:hypothetical protein KKF34_07295 [Myxococcota bacterium]|nr:hypothetical protein [Myxococcota bacterium]MBU1382820.1 hypothetical protein [Myxococcota bacterium]MBU1496664.1 hypothetical protein [Myxococcota bacterium]
MKKSVYFLTLFLFSILSACGEPAVTPNTYICETSSDCPDKQSCVNYFAYGFFFKDYGIMHYVNPVMASHEIGLNKPWEGICILPSDLKDDGINIEICDNGIDDDGDGKVDCADLQCKNLFNKVCKDSGGSNNSCAPYDAQMQAVTDLTTNGAFTFQDEGEECTQESFWTNVNSAAPDRWKQIPTKPDINQIFNILCNETEGRTPICAPGCKMGLINCDLINGMTNSKIEITYASAGPLPCTATEHQDVRCGDEIPESLFPRTDVFQCLGDVSRNEFYWEFITDCNTEPSSECARCLDIAGCDGSITFRCDAGISLECRDNNGTGNLDWYLYEDCAQSGKFCDEGSGMCILDGQCETGKFRCSNIYQDGPGDKVMRCDEQGSWGVSEDCTSNNNQVCYYGDNNGNIIVECRDEPTCGDSDWADWYEWCDPNVSGGFSCYTFGYDSPASPSCDTQCHLDFVPCTSPTANYNAGCTIGFKECSRNHIQGAHWYMQGPAGYLMTCSEWANGTGITYWTMEFCPNGCDEISGTCR